MDKKNNIITRTANPGDHIYASVISVTMEESAKQRGTGISKRSPESILKKMEEGKAVVAVTETGEWVGFAYIEVWSNGEFVSNSGMIVHPHFRGKGIARLLKNKVFVLARSKYPQAKIFSITTAAAMMRMNSALGFQPVIYDALPADGKFWMSCESCVNYAILKSKCYRNCLCTAMLFSPESVTLPVTII